MKFALKILRRLVHSRLMRRGIHIEVDSCYIGAVSVQGIKMSRSVMLDVMISQNGPMRDFF